MKLLLAICWSIILVADIFCCLAGEDASWILVFCPLAVVVLNTWLDFFDYE